MADLSNWYYEERPSTEEDQRREQSREDAARWVAAHHSDGNGASLGMYDDYDY